MRFVYTCLFYLLLPCILLRLWWRGGKSPAYRQRWHERLALYRQPYPQRVIWFHAVSVGEAEALFPLIKKHQQSQPQQPILITTTTPTGSARVTAVLQNTVSHVYLPYDLPDILQRFTNCFKPVLAVIMETEIWPNLYAHCGNCGIPLLLINARLSARSMRSYQRIPWLIKPALAQVNHIAAQSQEDAQRFLAIGASHPVTALGNIKFDVEISTELASLGKQLKNSLFGTRFVWLAASTHKGEEELLLPLYRQLKTQIPELLLVIAARHPERFREVADLCQQQQLNYITRTSSKTSKDDTDVYLLDTLGELKLFYSAADIAFVGGSLVPVGGHNVLEAAAVGVPIVFGPYMANFTAIATQILQHQAASQCQTVIELGETLIDLYNDTERRQQLVANGLEFIRANQGASQRVLDLLASFQPDESIHNP